MPDLPPAIAMLDTKERDEAAVSEGIACNRPEATRLPPAQPSRFKGYGLTRADNLEEQITVQFRGRDWVFHYNANEEKEIKQVARFYEREEDGARVVFTHMPADTPGMEQIAGDLRDAFFAMGHDVVHFASEDEPDKYITYRRA